jgi:hypothetical protein
LRPKIAPAGPEAGCRRVVFRPRLRLATGANRRINNRTKWNDDVARSSPHAAAVPLSDAEVQARRREVQQLTRSSLAWRAFT